MSNSSNFNNDSAICFPSLQVMRVAHSELLQSHRTNGITPEFLAEAEDFIRRGQATGMLLNKEEDRQLCQSLLDYWATLLSRSDYDLPNATLAEFDPEQFIRLSQQQSRERQNSDFSPNKCRVYAPNIYLFAFHLKDSNQPNLLWEKCNHLLSQKFGVTKTLEIEEYEGYRVDLFKDKTDDDVSLQFETTALLDEIPLPINGFALPLRIDDTYVLGLNIRLPEIDESGKKTESVPLSFIKILNPSGCLMPDYIRSSLGQTLILTVWYTEEKEWLPWKLPPNIQKLRYLADECLREFIPEGFSSPPFNCVGELFGSPIFEYGSASSSSSERYCHIIIWIYCISETSEKYVRFYSDFINLFYYRSKITTAYCESRSIYHDLLKFYKLLDSETSILINRYSSRENISQDERHDLYNYRFKELVQKNSNFYGFINDLEIYYQVVKNNINNYQRQVRNMSSRNPEDNFSFIKIFLDEDCYVFREQLQADIAYFKNGIASLEKVQNLIKTLREIEQAERNQTEAERYQMEIKRNQTEAERYQMEIMHYQTEAERERRLRTQYYPMETESNIRNIPFENEFYRRRWEEERYRSEDERYRRRWEEERFNSIKRTILILGVTMGTGSIVASSYAPSNKPLQLPFSKSIIQPVFATLLLSMMTAILAGLFTAALLRVMTRFRR